MQRCKVSLRLSDSDIGPQTSDFIFI